MSNHDKRVKIASQEFNAKIKKLEADFANKVDTLGDQLEKLDKDIRQLKEYQRRQEIDTEQKMDFKNIVYVMDNISDSHD